MSKHPNNEQENFDDMIRRKLEEYPLEFDSEAWSAMEKKLDKEEGGGAMSGGMRKIAGVLVFLLVLSFGGWYLLGNSGAEVGNTGYQSEEQLQKEGATVEGAAVAKDEEGVPDAVSEKIETGSSAAEKLEVRELEDKENRGSELVQKTDGSESTGKETVDNLKELSAKDQVKLKLKDEGRNVTSSNSEKEAASSARPGISSAGKQPKSSLAAYEVIHQDVQPEEEPVEDEKELQQILLPESEVGKDRDQYLIAKSGSDATGLRGRSGQSYPALQRKNWVPFFIMVDSVAPYNAEVENEKKGKKKNIIVPDENRRSRRGLPLSVSVTLAPDFTGTEQKESTKIGAGAGLLLEYEFLPNWSLLAGAFYSKKNYLADQAFSPYGKFWDYRPAPNYIDASCGVIDIPLNLRFYALNRNRNRLFLSAGASSYLMKSEDYTLVYEDSYYEDYTFSVKNENKHFLAIYNFSVGYQRNLSSHWSLQVEPFMKIPAKGVGIGSVKLNSMGAFLHLKYSFRK